MLAVFVWLLPMIVANTPLLPWIVKQATAELNGSATIQSASLGWFSPVGATGIEVRDKDGKSVVSIASLNGDRPLVAILCDYTNLGTFRLVGTKVSAVLRDDGSNVEDVLAKYLAPTKKKEKEKMPTQFAVGLDVVDASLSVADQVAGGKWQVNKVSVKFNMAKGNPAPMSGTVAAELPDELCPGKFSGDVKMTSAASEATLSVVQFPLAMLRPLAARLVPGTNVAGRLSTEARVTWGGQTAKRTDLRPASTW